MRTPRLAVSQLHHERCRDRREGVRDVHEAVADLDQIVRIEPCQIRSDVVGRSVGAGDDDLFQLHRPRPLDERLEDPLENVGLPCRAACRPPGLQLGVAQLGRGSDL
jgi:hypothetical protein